MFKKYIRELLLEFHITKASINSLSYLPLGLSEKGLENLKLRIYNSEHTIEISSYSPNQVQHPFFLLM